MSATESGPPPETYEMIMEATYRAFCEHGYADLTMRDIADEFEKSRSLLHYHYDTKQELIIALLEHLVTAYGEMRTSLGDDPVADLEQFVGESLLGPDEPGFEFLQFHAALLELRAQAHRNEVYREQLAASYQVFHDLMTRIIRSGIEDGSFREVDPEGYATLLLDAADGARTRAITLGHEEDLERARERILRELVDPLRTDRD
jgi:AcrR family transcriptional regulator